MNSSGLCVIFIGLLFQVMAEKWKEYDLADYIASNMSVRGGMKAEKTNAYLVCAEKTGVRPDTIISIKKGDWKDGNWKAKNWVQCVLMENNLMTEESVFRLDVAFKNVSPLERQSLEASIDKCLPTKAMPPVEISWQFAKCFQIENPENSLF